MEHRTPGLSTALEKIRAYTELQLDGNTSQADFRIVRNVSTDPLEFFIFRNGSDRPAVLHLWNTHPDSTSGFYVLDGKKSHMWLLGVGESMKMLLLPGEEVYGSRETPANDAVAMYAVVML